MRWSWRAEGDAVAASRAWWKILLAPFVFLSAIFAIQLLASFNTQFVERYYSRQLFPLITGCFAFARLSSFSLAELFLTLLLAASIVWLAWTARRLYVRRGQARRVLLVSLAARILWLCAFGLTLFMLAFGFNYQRPPLAETFQLAPREPTASEIETISRAVIEGINRNYAESHSSGIDDARDTNDAGSANNVDSRMPLTRAELYQTLEAAYEREPLLQGVASRSVVPPKPVYFSGLMSRFGISGVYSPLTGEPNYNAIQPDFDLPFVVAHEMAHQRGFAREDEANFIAFLICTKATHPYVRYSGYLNALRVLGVLYRLAPERYREMVTTIGEGGRADLKTRAKFWASYTGRLSSFGNNLNHMYLKANGIKSGVKNYNEAVWLIIGYYLKQMPPDSAPLAQ